MADVDTLANAFAADGLGFDFVGTTMRGYTTATQGVTIPDYAFLADLKAGLKSALPIAEGGVWEVGQLEQVMRADPYAVVIGTAVTRPKDITARFQAVFDRHAHAV